MAHKIKKRKIIFLTILVLCLAVLVGGIIYVWKGEEMTKSSNKPPTSPSEKSFPANKNPLPILVERVKIKKTSDPNILSWKNESESKNSSSFNEFDAFDTKKENIPKLLQESKIEKGSWINNWEQELKDNCWLVKEKRQELDQIVFSSWYENDQGEKLKELGSRKWW